MTLLKGEVEEVGGKPIKNATVHLFLGLPEPAVCVTNETGAFSFDSVKPGPYFLRVSAPGFMVCNQDIVIPKPDDHTSDTVIRLQKAEFEVWGHVKEEDDHPLRADVTLLKSGLVVQTTRTDEKTGAFQFPYLIEGNYEIYAISTCHAGRSWIGNIGKENDQVSLVLPVIEGCVTFDKCDVCEQKKVVRYCRFCHAFICDDCRHNYPERIKAMLRRRFSKQDMPKHEIQLVIEKELRDTTRNQRGRCSNCP